MLKEVFIIVTLSLLAVNVDARWHIHNPFKHIHIHNPLKHVHIRKTLDHLKNAVRGSLSHARQEVNKLKNQVVQLGKKTLNDAIHKLEKIFEGYLLQIPQIQKILGPALKIVQCVKNLEKQIKSLPTIIQKDLQKYIDGEINKILHDLEAGLKSEKEVEAILARLEQGWSSKEDKNDDALLKNINLQGNLPKDIDNAAARSLQAAQAALNSMIQLATNKVNTGGSQGSQIISAMKNCAKV